MRPTLLRSSILSMLGGITAAVGSFVGGVVIARTLELDEVGKVNFLIWAITVTAVFAQQGLGTALERFVPDMRMRVGAGACRLLVRRVALRVFAVAIACSVVWYALAEWAGIAGGLIVIVAAVAIPLQALSQVAIGYLRGLQSFGKQAALVAASAIVQLAGVFIGAVWFGAEGALAGFMSVSLLLVIFLVRQAVSAPRGPLATGERVWKFARQVWLAELIAALIWSRVEILFLQASAPGVEVAYFAIALSYANLAILVPFFLTRPLLAHFSSLAAHHDGRLQRSYERANRVVAALVFPACFGLIAVTPVLLPLLYGERFAPAVPIAMIVVGAASVGAVATSMGAVLYAADRPGAVTAINTVGVAVSAVAGFTVIPLLGAMGAGLSRIFVQSLLVAATAIYVSKRVDVSTPFGAMARSAAGAVISALAAHGVLVLVGGVSGLVLAVGAGIVTFALSLRLIGGLEEDDIVRLSQSSAQLPPSLGLLVGHALRGLARR